MQSYLIHISPYWACLESVKFVTHVCLLYSLKIYYNIIFQSTPRSSSTFFNLPLKIQFFKICLLFLTTYVCLVSVFILKYLSSMFIILTTCCSIKKYEFYPHSFTKFLYDFWKNLFFPWRVETDWSMYCVRNLFSLMCEL